MATSAGEGTSYEGGGGAGGKFRKRPLRRAPTTPYDRPPTALRNPKNNSGWLSKIVDPASKLISASAHLFFSSLLRKHLPPPPQQPPPATSQESTESLQEAVPINPSAVQQSVGRDRNSPPDSFGGSGISELEQLLKQRTFTRSEIDHLMDLLHSRTVDLPNKQEDKRTETSPVNPLSASGIRVRGTESYLESQRFGGCISTPVIDSQVLEKNISSPAELAKAYMGNKSSEVSPSTLGLHCQAQREDAILHNNVPFPAKSPVLSLVKPIGRVGIPENGFITPRSLGRSAIYNMARTPYFKVQPAPSQKTLKRRSSMVDDDIGFVGPVRRLRQKTNLSAQKSLNLPVARSPASGGIGVNFGVAKDPSSSREATLSLYEPTHRIPKSVGKTEDKSTRRTSYTPIPSKSTDVATRILQHLEQLVPKEKSSEAKVVAKGKSPNKLMVDMLHGQALRSIENVDSSKVLWSMQDSQMLTELQTTSLADTHDATSRMQNKVEENGIKELTVSCDTAVPAGNNDTSISVEDTLPCVESEDPVITESALRPYKEKWGFQMSAHEDFLELDDDIDSNEAACTSLTEDKGKLEPPVVESKYVPTEVVMLVETPALSESMPSTSPVAEKTSNVGTSTDGERTTGFTIAAASPPATTSQQTLVSFQSTMAFAKIIPPMESNGPPPTFSFSSDSVDKAPYLSFSASSPVTETSGSKFSVPSEPKLASTNSFVLFTSSAADTTSIIAMSDEVDNKDGLATAEAMGKPVTSVSAAVPTTTSASTIFTFGNLANKSSLSNGSLALSPPTFSSSSSLASGSFMCQPFTNTFSPSALSTATSTSTPNGTVTTTTSSSSLASSFPSTPIFKLGSTSVAPLNSVSAVSTATNVVSADLKSENEKETTFGNLTSTPFGGASSTATSAGSSIFGLSTTVTSSSNYSSGGPIFGGSDRPLVSTQASPPGTGSAIVTQSMPIQFGVSPPVFGSSEINSNSSPFGLSTTKMFSSSSGFGASCSASSSETNSTSTSGTTSSIFGCSWPLNTSSIFGSAFTSASPSTGFSFGQSSALAVATVSAPMVLGSSTGASSGSIFSFTSSIATASSSQAQPTFGSSFPAFATPSNNSDQMNMEDSMAEDPVQSSAPAVAVFGQPSIAPPSSGFVFGSTPPSAQPSFQFGGQLNQVTPSNPPVFQASGSLEFGAGGSFSLGSSGGDKSNRKIVRVKHKGRRK